MVLLGLTLAPALRRLSLYTVPQFIRRRYGSVAGLLASSLGVIGLLLFLSAQFFAMGSLVTQLAGIDRTTSILISGLAVVIYTWRGGSWAVHWSDSFQLIWILIGLVLAAGVGIHASGGLEQLAAPPAARSFEALGQSWFNPINRELTSGWNLFALGNTVIAWVIMSTTWHFAMQSTAQRVLSARDPKTASRACFLAAIVLVPIALAVALSGMAARVLYPNLEAPVGIEQVRALPALIQGVLEPVLAGVLLAAFVAAIMSTSDSALLGVATVFTKDLLPRFSRTREDSNSIRWVRAATVSFGLLAVVGALIAPTLVRMLEMVAAIYCVSLFVPLILGLYWSHANEKGAVAAMTISGPAGALWRVLNFETSTGIHMLNVSLPLAVVAMVGVSLATRNRDSKDSSEG